MTGPLFNAASLLALTLSAAAPDLQVLPDKVDGVEPRQMMHRYLNARVEQALDQREARYEQLEEQEQLLAYQKQMQKSFVEALGGFPERTPLNPRVVAKENREDYRVERIIFESQPRHFVTAMLYLPNTKPPYPAVLFPCGHSQNGKASEVYQRGNILLAKNGLASFCYDPIDQGERYQILDDEGKPVVGGTTAHCLVGVGSTLLGRGTATFRIWDGMRAIDYLQSRQDIDGQRIGCTGNSGGGTLTSYLMALDERIVCAAPSCYLCGYRRLCQTIGPQDAEQNIFGQIAHGMDHADYILMRAPKPTLMCTATQDFFDIDGAWNCFRQAKRWYTRHGFAEHVGIVETDAQHGFSGPLRVAMVRWMQRWLLERDQAIVESDFPIVDDQQMQCTPQGQVMRLPGARSTYDLNVELEESLAQKRKRQWKPDEHTRMLAQVRQITGIRKLADLAKPECEVVATSELENACKLQKVILRPEPGVWLPALVFVPAEPSGDTFLFLHADGKQKAASPRGPVQKLLRRGHIVMAVDVRGVGETAVPGESQRGIPHYLGPQWKELYLSYLLGTSYLAMRAEDILVSARFLAGHEAGSRPNRVRLVSVGRVGPPALHAVALEPQLFESASLVNCLASWSDVVHTPLATNQFENVVHGALKTYDLPDLLATLPAEKAAVIEPLDATEQPRQDEDSPPQETRRRGSPDDLSDALARAGDNKPQIQAAVNQVADARNEGMRFLVAHMPDRDLQSLSAEFLLENVRYAYRALDEAPWKDAVPKEIFLNNVLPYASINEQRDNWRKDFYERFKPLVKDVDSPSKAAAILNQKIFPLLNVRYSTRRPKADQSPYESIEANLASCTGLSVLLVDACRAVGVPARLVGTPRWSDNSGNHTWVEIWDDGWHFTGAAEPSGDQLDRAWFVQRASTAQRDEPRHAIYAVSYQWTPLAFPLSWNRRISYVRAVNVTDRYVNRAKELPDGQIRVRFRVLDQDARDRLAAKLRVVDRAGEVVFEGTTNDERFDANDHITASLRRGEEYQLTIQHGDKTISHTIQPTEEGQLFTFP